MVCLASQDGRYAYLLRSSLLNTNAIIANLAKDLSAYCRSFLSFGLVAVQVSLNFYTEFIGLNNALFVSLTSPAL